MNSIGMVSAGTGIGDWTLDNPPGEDRAARLEAGDFGFNRNLAKIRRSANRAAGVSARKHDHASRVLSRLSGVRHDPHPSRNWLNVQRSPGFLTWSKNVRLLPKAR